MNTDEIQAAPWSRSLAREPQSKKRSECNCNGRVPRPPPWYPSRYPQGPGLRPLEAALQHPLVRPAHSQGRWPGSCRSRARGHGPWTPLPAAVHAVEAAAGGATESALLARFAEYEWTEADAHHEPLAGSLTSLLPPCLVGTGTGSGCTATSPSPPTSIPSTRSGTSPSGTSSGTTEASHARPVAPPRGTLRRMPLFMWGFGWGGFADRSAAGAALCVFAVRFTSLTKDRKGRV